MYAISEPFWFSVLTTQSPLPLATDYSVLPAYMRTHAHSIHVRHRFLPLQLRIAKAAASEPGASSAASDNVSQAYAALAAAYQATDDHESSSQCLQELLEVANAQGNEAAQAEAAENLGLMHAHLGQRDAAQPYLTTAFELRRKLVNEGRCTRASLERLRILVGMVKGDARVAPLFSNIAAVDVKALLNWRVQRVELHDSAAAAAEQ